MLPKNIYVIEYLHRHARSIMYLGYTTYGEDVDTCLEHNLQHIVGGRGGNKMFYKFNYEIYVVNDKFGI